MLSRIKFEITPLVNEILDQLPASTWLSTTSTFLDPAMAGGQFVREIERRLRGAGHSDENIHSRVFGVEQFPHQVAYAVNKYKLKGNYVVGDFLSMEFGMKKFKYIVGNPPYQAPKSGDYGFWAKFVDKSHKLLSSAGHLALIIPAGWMSPTNDIRQGHRSVMRDIFAKENTSYINIDPNLGKKHFPGIGQKFTWFMLQKGKYSSTKLDLGEKTLNIDLSNMTMLAKDADEINIGIIKKLSSKPNRWEFGRYIMDEAWDDVKFCKDAKFTYPRINGNSNHLDKVVYSKKPCKFQTTKKVVLPYNGSAFTFVVDNGLVGCTNAYVIVLNKTDKIKSAKTYFNSALIAWLGKNKFTQYNEGALINSISKMDLSVELTEQAIYRFYGLTKSEIAYVEANVK